MRLAGGNEGFHTADGCLYGYAPEVAGSASAVEDPAAHAARRAGLPPPPPLRSSICRLRSALGLTRSEFDAYLDGTSQVYPLHLRNVGVLIQPQPLQSLREDGPGQPPQSFRYVAESDPSRLRDLVRPAPALTG